MKLTGEAVEDIKDLDGSSRGFVFNALKKLRDEPEKRGSSLGSHKSSNLTGYRKLVVAKRNLRMVYRVEADGQVVVVVVVAKREDGYVYELAMSRLELSGNPKVQAIKEALRDLMRSSSQRACRAKIVRTPSPETP